MKNEVLPLVSVIIPAYNEVHTILKVIDLVTKTLEFDFEIIAVNDGSTDGTKKALSTVKNPLVRVTHHKQNQGKTAAINTGLKMAKGKFIAIQDADLEYAPKDLNRLVQPLFLGEADVVYGTRFRGSEPHRIMYYWHYLANQWLTVLSNIFTNLNLSDMETGYKIFSKEALKDIQLVESGFGLEPEITAKFAISGARFYEMGIEYHGRTYEDGKKIGWRDGLQAIGIILKYGWLFRIKPWLLES